MTTPASLVRGLRTCGNYDYFSIVTQTKTLITNYLSSTTLANFFQTRNQETQQKYASYISKLETIKSQFETAAIKGSVELSYDSILAFAQRHPGMFDIIQASYDLKDQERNENSDDQIPDHIKILEIAELMYNGKFVYYTKDEIQALRENDVRTQIHDLTNDCRQIDATGSNAIQLIRKVPDDVAVGTPVFTNIVRDANGVIHPRNALTTATGSPEKFRAIVTETNEINYETYSLFEYSAPMVQVVDEQNNFHQFSVTQLYLDSDAMNCDYIKEQVLSELSKNINETKIDNTKLYKELKINYANIASKKSPVQFLTIVFDNLMSNVKMVYADFVVKNYILYCGVEKQEQINIFDDIVKYAINRSANENRKQILLKIRTTKQKLKNAKFNIESKLTTAGSTKRKQNKKSQKNKKVKKTLKKYAENKNGVSSLTYEDNSARTSLTP